MQGQSRTAQAETRRSLQAALDSGADWRQLSDDLFNVVALLDSNVTVRRALADPTREADTRRGIADRLLRGKIGDAALGVVTAAVGSRWSHERDLATALNEAAVEAQVAMADAAGRADDVEEQLFRFERTVAANPELRDALGDPALPVDRKLSIVDQLLGDRVHPETARLLRQVVLNPRGRRFGPALEDILDVAARRRSQLAAVVTVATELDQARHDRLAAALGSIYGRPVQLKVVVDPAVVGGIRVQVCYDVIDGTISSKLDSARRHFGA
ncbi:F0F1 ATP synthase subunit delta [Arsenicicoccus piscis]|uniref:ATP synthase subunit delta n=1 Tax=Arsenicicoccus piscis TaxID=673954 RepID=A0ABQ6HRZ1_9MICO|nr:F0F1 ATP synthase subunit delta [Arsenicicoccus piscis]MCH8629152.1 F0F1 ATP synthase subunit delta [Arsenicicoccus piscis]GMA20284.1 ATP synthase subunit delta [Arsenicicoccus piscis]